MILLVFWGGFVATTIKPSGWPTTIPTDIPMVQLLRPKNICSDHFSYIYIFPIHYNHLIFIWYSLKKFKILSEKNVILPWIAPTLGSAFNIEPFYIVAGSAVVEWEGHPPQTLLWYGQILVAIIFCAAPIKMPLILVTSNWKSRLSAPGFFTPTVWWGSLPRVNSPQGEFRQTQYYSYIYYYYL